MKAMNAGSQFSMKLRGLLRKEFILQASVLLLLLLLTAGVSSVSRSPFTSAEVKFTDPSVHGLAIVPASCPSDPHYQGECNTTNPVPLSCSLSSSSWIVTQGQSAQLSWIGPEGQGSLGLPVTYVSGNITGIGSVPQRGTATITPQRTTTYVFHGIESWAGVFRSSFECDATVTVLANCPAGQIRGIDGRCRAACLAGTSLGADGVCHPGTCPAGQIFGNDGLCHSSTCPEGQSLGADARCHAVACPGPFFYCGTGAAASNLYQQTYVAPPACAAMNTLFATCLYGCSRNACNPAPTNPDGTITVQPQLVRSGDTVQVTWTSVDTLSCTVRGSNGDGTGRNATGTWDALRDVKMSSPITSQTTYTLDCVPRGARPAHIIRTAIVTVIPTFKEL